MNFAEKLTRALKDSHISQSELQRRTSLMRQTAISRWCSGEGRPYFDQVALLSRQLGVSLDDLVDDSLEAVVPIATLPDVQRGTRPHLGELGWMQSQFVRK